MANITIVCSGNNASVRPSDFWVWDSKYTMIMTKL